MFDAARRGDRAGGKAETSRLHPKTHWQTPAVHVPDTQSVPTLHVIVATHFAQRPPQSTSDSVPSFVVSEQVAGMSHELVVQLALTHSAAPEQAAPVSPLQAPRPSQVRLFASRHAPSSQPAGTAVHAPSLPARPQE